MKEIKNIFIKRLFFYSKKIDQFFDYVFNHIVVLYLFDVQALFPIGIVITILFFQEGWLNGENWILWITFLALLWYSRETVLMRNEQQKSNEISYRPIMDLYIEKCPHQGWSCDCLGGADELFILRNVGKGVAYNIFFEDIEDYNRYHFEFEEVGRILIPMLIPNESKSLDVTAWLENGGLALKNDALRIMKNELGNPKKDEHIFRIRYSDIEGQKYYSIFRFYKRHAATRELCIDFCGSGKGNPEKLKKIACKIKRQKSQFDSRK